MSDGAGDVPETALWLATRSRVRCIRGTFDTVVGATLSLIALKQAGATPSELDAMTSCCDNFDRSPANPRSGPVARTYQSCRAVREAL